MTTNALNEKIAQPYERATYVRQDKGINNY